MTMSSVPDQVDEEVFVELFSVVQGDFHASVHQLRFVSVYVDHWGIDDLGELSAMVGGSILLWLSGKAYIVVEHDMNNSSCAIIIQLFKVNRFVDDPLTTKGSIAVNDNP